MVALAEALDSSSGLSIDEELSRATTVEAPSPTDDPLSRTQKELSRATTVEASSPTADEDMLATITRTREALHSILDAKTLSAAELSSPPFRLLHDVISAVATRTRFGAGMYTAEEQDPDSPELQSPEAQQVYLSKAAGLVGASLGAPVPMRVADAVAGDDPRGANEFLQQLAEAATKAAPKTRPPGGAAAATASSASRVKGPTISGTKGPPPRPRSALSSKGPPLTNAPPSAAAVRAAVRAGSAAASAKPSPPGRRPRPPPVAVHGGRSSSRPTTIPSAPRLSPTKLQRANSEPVKPTPTSPAPPPAPVPVASTTPGAWACAGCGFDENEPDLHYCRRCARIRKAGGASPLRREGSGREEEEVQVNSAAAGEHFRAPAAAKPPPMKGRRVSEPTIRRAASEGGAARRTRGAPPRAPPPGAPSPAPPKVERPNSAASSGGGRSPVYDDDDDDDEGGGGGGWYEEELSRRWQAYQQQQSARDAARKDAAKAAAARPAPRAASADGGAARTRARHLEDAWLRFEQKHSGGVGTIRAADIPWPPLDDAAALGLDARYASSADRRRAFRTANLRWHPDRFVQAWGGLLAADERDAVLQRVTEVSQAINALNQAQPD